MNSTAFIRTLMLLAGITVSTHLHGQSSNAKQDTNGITVVEDKRVPKLVNTYIETQPEGVAGSRVQIFFTAKKAMALEVKTTFMEKFPDYVVLVDYDPPNFKVLAGAFRTKLQAEKLLGLVREEFPGSFIVTDHVPMEELNPKD
jgi:hypothetical protein